MKHFKAYEIVDKNTYEALGEDALRLFPYHSLLMLDGLREFFDVPITVNTWHSGGQFQWRGFRTIHCKEGAKQSYHRRGMAFDCDVRNYTAEEARKKILSNEDDPLLQYVNRIEDGVNWLHIDSGTVPEGKQRIYLFKA
ncbi:MAG: Peptidase M15 [Bacteroidetes bacterium ADurb.Bin012]|jgi:hypothetical protein|nr:MAG: Peptidase M15 [Bacteroidetes bacterium ADurb.Bin012]